MLEDLKQQLNGQYPEGCAGILEEAEKILSLPAFDSAKALEIGCTLVKKAQEYPEGIAVCITREEDGVPVFQYVSEDRSQRNLDFAMLKRNTVLRTGHCSLWAMAQEQTMGGLGSLFAEGSGCLPVGGAFPLYVGRDLQAVIAVSGLHNGMDHKLIVDALCEYSGKSVPDFPGKLI